MTLTPPPNRSVFQKLLARLHREGPWRTAQFLRDRLRSFWQNHIRQPAWVRDSQLAPKAVAQAQAQIATWSNPPHISVLMPVYNVEEVWLRRAIASVQAQLYPHWELCIVDDASTVPHIQPVLQEYAAADPRIKVTVRRENGNIAVASNTALDMATGEFVALLDHDDELAPHALFEVAQVIQAHPDLDFIYSDEDKLMPSGKRQSPCFKPDWSPDFFHTCMYTCHLGVYRTALIRAIGGFREGYAGAQDWDLVLRLVEKTPRIHHIPKLLYHWRIIPASITSGEQAKPWALQAAQKALAEMLQRSAYPGWVEKTPYPGHFRVRRHLATQPKVSLILPIAPQTEPNSQLTDVAHWQQTSPYPHWELIAVPLAASPAQQVSSGALAAQLNAGAAQATGSVLLFLDPRLRPLDAEWLEALLEFAQQPAIGAVGGKLLTADGRLDHVGLTLIGGTPQVLGRGLAADAPGYLLAHQLPRNVLAVSGACLMVRREAFQAVQGFDAQLPTDSDLDFCLKLHQAGYRNVFTPYARLEWTAAWHPPTAIAPPAALQQKWAAYLQQLGGDPYLNPNLLRYYAEFLFQ